MYCTVKDMTLQVSEKILARAAGHGDGSLDTARLENAIQNASNEIDSYCRALYKVPFSSPSDRVRGLTVDIALYNIYSGVGFNFSSDSQDRIIYERYKSAIDFLKLVAAGKVELEEGDAGGGIAASTNSYGTKNLRISSEKRIFGRSNMRDF